MISNLEKVYYCGRVGIEIWSDGAKYEGEFKEGKKNGKGKFVWNDNSTYEGDFRDNSLEGYGII